MPIFILCHHVDSIRSVKLILLSLPEGWKLPAELLYEYPVAVVSDLRVQALRKCSWRARNDNHIPPQTMTMRSGGLDCATGNYVTGNLDRLLRIAGDDMFINLRLPMH